MYKGLYTFNEAIARFPKGDRIFSKKECVVKIQETKIFRMMLLIPLEDLKDFLFMLITHLETTNLLVSYSIICGRHIEDSIFKCVRYSRINASSVTKQKENSKKNKPIVKTHQSRKFSSSYSM